MIEDFVIKRNSALLWFVFAATLRAESCLLSVELVDQQSFFWGWGSGLECLQLPR